MLCQLCAAWRARRVLLISEGTDTSATLQDWLTILGARCTSLPPDTDAENLYRALTAGRVFAVILCCRARDTLLCEIREAGVPLTILCPAGDAQEIALRALHLGERFLSENMPCGVYDLNNFS